MRAERLRQLEKTSQHPGAQPSPVERMGFWDAPRDFSTKASSVVLVDTDQGLQMWINESSGGAVDHKTKRCKVPVATAWGTFQGDQKISDTFVIKADWRPGDGKSKTVMVRISSVGYGNRAISSREFHITFKRP